MSLPPQVIQVKRKRAEEGPVPSFLRIEHATKRHRSDAFLYRRHDPEAAAAAAAAAAGDAVARANRPPAILVSQPGAEKRKSVGGAAREASVTSSTATATAAATAPAGSLPLPAPPPRAPSPSPSPTPTPAQHRAVEPRRFHLSRDTLLMAAHRHNAARRLQRQQRMHANPSSRGSGSSGGLTAADTAVFVERSGGGGSGGGASKKKRRPRQYEGAAELRKKASIAALRAGAGARIEAEAAAAAVAPLPKRPGVNAGRLTPKPSLSSMTTAPPATAVAADGQTAAPAPVLPGSVANRRWDTDMDQLARDMNAYTLEILGRNLAQMEQQKPHGSSLSGGHSGGAGVMTRWEAERRRAAYAKYKPKPVAQSAAEKQRLGAAAATAKRSDARLNTGPGSSSATATDDDDDDDDGAASETDSDDDYVTETYVRIPGHEAPPQAQAGAVGAAAGTVGLLVFDHEPDLEFFYGVEEDSEEEFDDDEDENAENYYTHDYPEDEVSSDDEFGRDPYHYVTGNASDEEEYVVSDVDEKL